MASNVMKFPSPKGDQLPLDLINNPIALAHRSKGRSVLDYTVEKRNVYVGQTLDSAIVDPASCALVRADNNRCLGIMGHGYGLMQNREIFTRIETQMLKALSHDELRDINYADHITHGGARAYREYTLPNVVCGQSRRYTDKPIAFRMIVGNGFSMGSISLLFGAIDFYCTNGMVIGEYVKAYRRHTGKVAQWNFEKYIRESIDVFYKERDRWAKYIKMIIDDATAVKVINELPGASDRLKKRLFERWIVESKERGRSVWALYSTLTNYASHDEVQPIRNTKNDHGYDTRLKRAKQVMGWQRTLDQVANAA